MIADCGTTLMMWMDECMAATPRRCRQQMESAGEGVVERESEAPPLHSDQFLAVDDNTSNKCFRPRLQLAAFFPEMEVSAYFQSINRPLFLLYYQRN